MIEWRDEGVLLAVRKHGENAVIIEVFTENHGRHSGVVRGGAGRKQTPVLQPGGQIEVVWKARLEEHLGSFTAEPLRSRAAQVMADPLALAGLTSAVGLLSFSLPEREIHPILYKTSVSLLDLMCVTEAWPLAYLHWDIQLLEVLGFGLVPCMIGDSMSGNGEVAEGLRTTGHFLEKWLAPSLGDRALPLARRRFVERMFRVSAD